MHGCKYRKQRETIHGHRTEEDGPLVGEVSKVREVECEEPCTETCLQTVC